MQKVFISFLIIICLAQSEDLLAQKRNRMKKKPSSSAKKRGKAANRKSQMNNGFIWLDGFLGYSPILNGGPFLEYQKQYYQTQNPGFNPSCSYPSITFCLKAGWSF